MQLVSLSDGFERLALACSRFVLLRYSEGSSQGWTALTFAGRSFGVPQDDKDKAMGLTVCNT